MRRAIRYDGAQTARSLANFDIGGEKMPAEIIRAFGIPQEGGSHRQPQARACSLQSCATSIVASADEVPDGKLKDHFPLVVWQTGLDTQSNMNVNEVISNRAIEMAGGTMGSKKPVHPNDHVNMEPEFERYLPTAMHVAAVAAIEDYLIDRVMLLRNTLDLKATEFMAIVKIGRTHLQDATPLTLGQEISGWVAQLDLALAAIRGDLAATLRTGIGRHRCGHRAQRASEVR